MFYFRFVARAMDAWEDLISRLINRSDTARYNRKTVTFSPWMQPGLSWLMAPPILLFVGGPIALFVYLLLRLPDRLVAPVGIAAGLLLLIYSATQAVRLSRRK